MPTVSRVLTGSIPVSPKTKARVFAAIKTLGYRPNGAARALVRGRQSIIGILTSNTVRYGYSSTILGVEEAARAAGYMVAITILESEADAAIDAAVDLMLGQPLEGVVVLDFDVLGSKALRALPSTTPVVAVTSSTEAVAEHKLRFDDRLGGRLATEYLLSVGHRTVHHVAVPGVDGPSGRMLGWLDALNAHGARVPEVIEANWTPGSGYEIGLGLADLGDITAVFCGNDETAFGVIRGLKARHLDVPGDISVVGFDNHPHAVLWSPALTTVAFDFVQLGALSVDLLLRAAGMESTLEVSAPIPTMHLVVRASVAPPRTENAQASTHPVWTPSERRG